jgi:hypothetical protein
MRFREWMTMEGMRDLARAYSDALRDVPENPEHHPEGTTLKHVKLVRRAVDAAAEQLQTLKSEHSLSYILSNLDFRLTEDDRQVLVMAAWLHDVGKTTATTIGGVPFRDAGNSAGKIQAIGHERPEHYGPQVEKMLAMAPESTRRLYESNRDLISFLIERHMDFSHGGFPNRVIADFFDDGRVRDDRRMRLLLVLMWADKMGRGKAPDLAKSIEKLRLASEKSRDMARKAARQSKGAFEGGEDEFRSMLKARGLPDSAIDAAVRSKFGSS